MVCLLQPQLLLPVSLSIIPQLLFTHLLLFRFRERNRFNIVDTRGAWTSLHQQREFDRSQLLRLQHRSFFLLLVRLQVFEEREHVTVGDRLVLVDLLRLPLIHHHLGDLSRVYLVMRVNVLFWLVTPQWIRGGVAAPTTVVLGAALDYFLVHLAGCLRLVS